MSVTGWSATSRRVSALVHAVLLLGCGGREDDSSAGARARAADETPTAAGGRTCGSDRCAEDEMCVETQGAVCMPLPPPGEECRLGCVLTEHCCNCSAFACFGPSAADCPDGPRCECLDRSDGTAVLVDCAGERRECTEQSGLVDVLCVRVGLDEDPFADGGAPSP